MPASASPSTRSASILELAAPRFTPSVTVFTTRLISASVSSRLFSALSVTSRTAVRRFSPCFTDSRAKPFSTSSVSMRPPWMAASCTVYQTAINLALEVVVAADAEEADRLLGIGHDAAAVRIGPVVPRPVVGAEAVVRVLEAQAQVLLQRVLRRQLGDHAVVAHVRRRRHAGGRPAVAGLGAVRRERPPRADPQLGGGLAPPRAAQGR